MPKAKAEVQEKNKLSKYIKKKPKSVISKRENTYVFEGFYERLKAIDVKHAHSLEANFTYDKLLEERDLLDGEDAELFKSNFIQLLRSEKANNKTIEFSKVYSDIERFCFSYPLLIHNKTKIIERLLHHLSQGTNSSQKVVQAGVIDLFIALIKDFRADIYQDFLKLIMPNVIGALDISNVTLVDKIFTLLSFGVKYLTKSIKDDLQNFYETYSEMLSHRNKFVRKFAAQAFCFVVRKLPFDSKLLSIILSPLEKSNLDDLSKHHDLDKIVGLSELLFEVVYGASEGLHSRAKEMLHQVLQYQSMKEDTGSVKTVARCLFAKLINEVDTEKHQVIYESLAKGLEWEEDEKDLQMYLVIVKDIIKLKHGRRVSQYGMVAMTEFLNTLLQTNIQKTQKLSLQSKMSIAETLSILYYYKHNQVLNIFISANLDFSASKNLFTHYIYLLATSESSLPVLRTYFSLFSVSPSQIITTFEGNLDLPTILGLKQSTSQQMEFSKESHRAKLRLLLKSFNKHILKQISSSSVTNNVIVEHLGLFEMIALQMGEQESLVVEIGSEDTERRLCEINSASVITIKEGMYLSSKVSGIEQFIVMKFIARCRCKPEGILVQAMKKVKNGEEVKKGEPIDISSQVKENFVLKNYEISEQRVKELQECVEEIIDFDNQGDVRKVEVQIESLRNIFLQRNAPSNSQQQNLINLLLKNPSDIVTLKAFNTLPNETLLKLSNQQDLTLFKKLSSNLLKNQRELRLQTLRILNKKFQREDSKSDQLSIVVKCDAIELMHNFEELDIAFETEKGKILQLERIKSHIDNRSIPESYLNVIYNFLLGCFWIKFTPIFQYASNTLQLLIREYPELFGQSCLSLIENLNYLTQLAHDNERLFEIFVSKQETCTDSMSLQGYLKETTLEDDFMDVKDFFYNVVKSVCISTVMERKELRPRFLDIFYSFIDNEYAPLHFHKHTLSSSSHSNNKGDSLRLDRMTYANMIESDDYKKYRRQAYSKIYCFLELLQRADNLKKLPRLSSFQQLMLRLLNTNDNKLQKLALECLLKADDKGVVRQYRKLLEGFTDDLKFKDMIPVVTFGSQGGASNKKEEQMTEAAGEDEALKKQDAKGNNIPKLAEGHRLEVLPIIIKLLLSKLIKKKGAINQKTVHTRRSIVFSFMAQLKPDTELKLFFNELLSPLDLSIDDDVSDIYSLKQKLSQASFNAYQNFIGSLEIILRQMGGLLARNGYLEKIMIVFVQVLSLTKIFIKHLKLSIAEDKNEEIKEESSSDVEMESEDEEIVNVKQSLYRFVGHQSKACMRKGLGIIKQIYNRYSNIEVFIRDFSKQVYDELIEDQLSSLNTNFISDKSQLVEILTTSWSQSAPGNYLAYPHAFTALLSMLAQDKLNPEVYDLHLSMLRSLVMKSIVGLEDKKDLAFLYKKNSYLESKNKESEDEEETAVSALEQAKERETAQQIIRKYIKEIASGLNAFCQIHLSELKKTLLARQKHGPRVMGQKPTVHEVKGQSIRVLVFVMSQVADYLKEGDQVNLNFLEMIVSVIGMKNLHVESAHNTYFEELLHFGVKSVVNLMIKVKKVDDTLIDKIFQMFLSLKSLRIRTNLAQGLQSALPKQVSPKVLEVIVSLTKLRRGAADLELDYDLVIKTIQKIIEDEEFNQSLKTLELNSITYLILSLLTNDEFSVRDFASHFLKKTLFGGLIAKYPHLLNLIELTLLRGLTRPQDEMILKTVLDVLRHYISYLKQSQNQTSQIVSLSCLVNIKDDNDDFFAMFLAIKMKTRQRAMKMMASKIQEIDNYKAISMVVMPLINYIIFGEASQKQNRRNTISYTRDERRATLDEALNLYQSLAASLKWSDYFRLLKSLLFKLQRVSYKASFSKQQEGGSAPDEDISNQEKIVTKCICKVLNGFNLQGVADSGEEFLKVGYQLPQKEEEKGQPPAFSGLEIGVDFAEVIQNAMNEEEDSEVEEDDEEPMIKKKDDVEMEVSGQEGITEIQQKLQQKVLPILERHLMDSPKVSRGEDSQPTVRTFVVLSIIKTLRKLPLSIFQQGISKLVTTIVSKGLRQRELNCREKGRKALLKLLEELTPRSASLSLVFSEMKDQLQKGGYQLHTFVYSVHYLLQQLNESKLLKAGDVSTQMIDLLAEKFLDELFTSNSGVDGTLEDIEKVKIKESKSKKAIPVFEQFAQFMNFKASFFSLIAPVMRTLEENPTITKIQQCEELLNRVSNTLLKNESLCADELMLFTYTIIQRGVSMAVKVKVNDDRGIERDYGAKKKDIFIRTKEEYKDMTYAVQMNWKKTGQQLNDKKTQEICGRVLGSFGLQCLKRALKTTSLILKPSQTVTDENIEVEQVTEEDLKAKLDPFVILLLDAFKTYHNPIIVTALHVLGQLIPLGLPSFKDLMKKFLNKLFKLFESSGSSVDNDFLNSLFRCTAELIRTYATYQDLSQPQLKTLVTIIKAHLNASSTQTNVFHCLRALVYRKFICADLYDLMETVQDLMITSIARSTRTICSSIFTQFMLEYPLEETRVEQHINHLLKNLAYFDSEGRLQVLDILHNLIERFPRELTDQYAELIFFTLTLRVVNETHTKVRERVLAVLKRLFLKASPAKSKALFNTVIQMNQQGGNELKRRQLCQARLVVMKAWVDSQGAQIKSTDAVKVIEVCMETVQKEALIIVETKGKRQKRDESSDSQDDEEVHNPEMKQFLKNIELMEEDQAQVKAPVQHQFTIDFEEEKHSSEWSPLYFALLNIENLISQQVASNFKLMQNLIPNILLLGLHHHTYWIRLGVQRIFGALFSTENISLQKALGVENSNGVIDIMFKLTSCFKFRPQLDEEMGNQLVKNITFLLRSTLKDQQLDITRLFNRCSIFGRKLMLNVQTAKPLIANILLFFQVAFHLFTQINDSTSDNTPARAVLAPVLDLVYRIYTDEQYSDSRAKELSFELVDYLSTAIDKSFFINAYNEAKASVHKKRLERKRQQKVMMASAQGAQVKERKRARKVEKKKEKKRQKIMEFELRKN